MKTNTIIIVAVVAVVAFFVWQRYSASEIAAVTHKDLVKVLNGSEK